MFFICRSSEITREVLGDICFFSSPFPFSFFSLSLSVARPRAFFSLSRSLLHNPKDRINNDEKTQKKEEEEEEEKPTTRMELMMACFLFSHMSKHKSTHDRVHPEHSVFSHVICQVNSARFFSHQERERASESLPHV